MPDDGSIMNAKRAAAGKAVGLIANGMTIGLGSGSTAGYAVDILGERVKNGLRIQAVATSLKTEALARKWMIPVADPSRIDHIDLAIDGADEVDTSGNLIKGGGGSLLREKIIAFASRKFYVIIDDSKVVTRLGDARALPVEIVPFAAAHTMKHLRLLPCMPELRQVEGKPFVTDNGNLIADCRFEGITDPAWMDLRIKMIPGVVETGLFSAKIVTAIFIASPSGEVKEIRIDPAS